MKDIKQYILNEIANRRLSKKDGKELLLSLDKTEDRDIAIIGTACEFSNCKNKYEFFENIEKGINCLRTFDPDRVDYLAPINDNPQILKFFSGGETQMLSSSFKAGYIDNVDKFDAKFFGIPPREAEYMDPIQRKYLEVSMEALEDAGYGGEKIRNTNTGVYVGRDNTCPTFYRYLVQDDPMIYTGTWEGILASRISYIYNLRGPAMVMDTACSSGLVALHTAIHAIRNKECSMAMAGGIALGSAPQRSGADSDDVLANVQATQNEVRSFDKDSSGTIFGEGVGVVVLKPLKDALRDRDHIYAVVKGSAINNDGASNGITAPNPEAQMEVYVKAWEDAKIDPTTIDYIETHGTGTKLGDPIEIKSLTRAFEQYTDKKQFCGIGTVKTNIGHTVAASGVAGLLKVVHCMNNKKFYGNINFSIPNPHIDFISSPLYMVDSTRDWVKDGKRRAAVSAFGFSGTNAHVVLEEYVPPMRDMEEISQLFTISAKTNTALQNTINAYTDFFKHATDLNLNDICYTANEGRGQYEYRVAFFVSSKEELIKKLAYITDNGLETNDELGIIYGSNKVISDKKEKVGVGEITSTMKHELTDRNDEIINLLVKDRTEKNLLLELADNYVKGATINWSNYYADLDVLKVSLPSYQFDRTHYWGVERDVTVESSTVAGKKIDDYYLDKLLLSSVNQDVYSAVFSPERYWFVDEHKIFGKNMIPGAAYPDMFRHVARMYYGDVPLEFREMIFYTPLITGEGEREAQVIVQKETDYLKIIVVSADETYTENPEWITHVESRVYVNQDTAPKALDVSGLENSMHRESISFKFSEKAVDFGERWNNVRELYTDDEHILGTMELDEALHDDFKESDIHAAMLDMAINAFGSFSLKNALYLPFVYKSIKYYKPIRGKILSYATKVGENSQTHTYNYLITDENGEVCLEITEYTMKKINRVEDVIGSKNVFNAVRWGKNISDIKKGHMLDGNILLFKDELGKFEKIATRFRNVERKVYEVSFGTEYKKLDEFSYEIDGTEESYLQLMHDLSVKNINYFMHLSSMTKCQTEETMEQVEYNNVRGLNSMFLMVKALLNSKISKNPTIFCFVQNADDVSGKDTVIYPQNNAMGGVLKAVYHEYPNVVSKYADIDDSVDINQIIDVLLGFEGTKRLAVRDGNYYEEQLAKFSMSELSEEEIVYRQDGAYVITGATGGMGSVFAKYIGTNGNINICLLGTKSIDLNDASHEKVQLINELVEMGNNVSYYVADVGNYEQMEKVFDSIHETYGNINAVFHCAGIPGNGYIINKEQSVFQSVITPKREGTWIIDKLTENDDMQFLYLASSMTTVIGAPGNSDYCAANLYLDSFAKSRVVKGKKTISLNWPGWSEVGMATREGLDVNMGLFAPVSNQKALLILEEAIKKNIVHAVPGEINVVSAIKMGLVGILNVSANIWHLMDMEEKKMQRASAENSQLSTNDITIDGKNEGNYSVTEITLGKIFGMVLGINNIDIYDHISDLGADSIIITQIYKVIDQQYKGMIDISDIFLYNSVAELAEHIDKKMTKDETDDLDAVAEKLLTGEFGIEDLV